jgi:hypothetical protein
MGMRNIAELVAMLAIGDGVIRLVAREGTASCGGSARRATGRLSRQLRKAR